MSGDGKVLDGAVEGLAKWKEEQVAAKRSPAKRCLESVRAALSGQGMRLPRSGVDYRGMYAISCGAALAKDPKKWGWKHLDLAKGANPPDGSLVFFDNCGKLFDKEGRYKGTAGHIAILKNGMLHANQDYTMSPYWRDRVAYVFVRE